MMILRTKDKNSLIQIAQKTLKTPLEIWMYGSRVIGLAHECSDLDIVLRTQNKKPLDSNELVAFTEAIEESNIPFVVQVFDWLRMPESFRQNVLQQYEVLLSNFQKVKTDE